MKITSIETIPVRVPIRAEFQIQGALAAHTDSPFVVLKVHTDDGLTRAGGSFVHTHLEAGYLGPQHAGVSLEVNPENPMPFATPAGGVTPEEQRREFDFLKKLNGLSAVEYPTYAALRARLKAYDLAFRMQMAVPEAIRFKEESEETRRLYGMDQEVTKPFGEVCLAARRLSERAVRFVQVYHGGAGECVGRAQGFAEESR